MGALERSLPTGSEPLVDSLCSLKINILVGYEERSFVAMLLGIEILIGISS